MKSHGVFVTGTDTGVGKTLVSCTLARGLRLRGTDVGVMKPAETGVGVEGPQDAIALRQAAGVDDDLELICPQRFAMPAAPSVAAAAEGRSVDLAVIEASFRRLAARHDFMIVEGAGGLRVPITGDRDMADLAQALELPLLVVARAALGTINHTLLTLEAIQQQGLPLAGVVISHTTGALSGADASNLEALRQALGQRGVGEIGPAADVASIDPSALDLETVLAAAQ